MEEVRNEVCDPEHYPQHCVGLGEACNIYSKEMEKENKTLTKYKEMMLEGIRKSCPDVYLNGSEMSRFQGILTLALRMLKVNR